MRLLTTKRFERDLKRSRKRGKKLDKLWSVVEGLCFCLNGPYSLVAATYSRGPDKSVALKSLLSNMPKVRKPLASNNCFSSAGKKQTILTEIFYRWASRDAPGPSADKQLPAAIKSVYGNRRRSEGNSIYFKFRLFLECAASQIAGGIVEVQNEERAPSVHGGRRYPEPGPLLHW